MWLRATPKGPVKVKCRTNDDKNDDDDDVLVIHFGNADVDHVQTLGNISVENNHDRS